VDMAVRPVFLCGHRLLGFFKNIIKEKKIAFLYLSTSLSLSYELIITTKFFLTLNKENRYLNDI